MNYNIMYVLYDNLYAVIREVVLYSFTHAFPMWIKILIFPIDPFTILYHRS